MAGVRASSGRRIVGASIALLALTVGLRAQPSLFATWRPVLCARTAAVCGEPSCCATPTTVTITDQPVSPSGFFVRPKPAVAAQWTTICSATGFGGGATSSCPVSTIAARGFLWGTAAFDDVNQEFLLLMSVGLANADIYSDDLVGVNIRTNTITPRVLQNISGRADGCAPNGGIAATRNPPYGHPRGGSWFDSIVKKFYNTVPLCGGPTVPLTGVYNAQTRTMDPLLNHWLLEPSLGGYSFESGAAFVPAYGRAIFCCGDQQFSTRMSEFSAATGAFVNISTQVRGLDGRGCDVNVSSPVSVHCPILFYGATVMSDGAAVWIFGGTNNQLTLFNDLYRYDPVLKQVTKIAPVGGVKPPNTDSGFPIAFVDTKRQRIVVLAKSDTLWEYRIATNTWSPFSAAGQSTNTDEMRTTVPNYFDNAYAAGRQAGYDPGADCAIVVQSHGQAASPDIRKLCFTGS